MVIRKKSLAHLLTVVLQRWLVEGHSRAVCELDTTVQDNRRINSSVVKCVLNHSVL